MSVTRPFSARLLALAVALAINASGIGAQSETERPSVSLTQYPDLTSEVWPADVNEDGISDLVAARRISSTTSLLVLTIGRGDGTFEAPVEIASNVGAPAGVGDLNADGFIDIVTTASLIFAGQGDGTFVGPAAAPGPIAAPTEFADMNNDGRIDLVSHLNAAIRIYPGNGDFTFSDSVGLNAGFMPEAMVTGDFNNDGFRDIATTTKEGQSRINVFLNQGALTFALTPILISRPGGGITVRDLNADGVTDLVVGSGQFNFTQNSWRDGFVSVFLGKGDGTFGQPLEFATNRGPTRVVAGDFNGDGIADVATGNRSTVDECESIGFLWDSVSILLGRGDGTLMPAFSFALGDSDVLPDSVYKRSLHRLNTSDLNADGRTDLIASPGAVLLAGPPSANRPPAVDAGPDRVDPIYEFSLRHRGVATDPDHDWLTFEWRDEFGRVVGDVPNECLNPNTGTRTFTLTASDGRGGVGSDSMQWSLGAEPPLPSGAQSTAIGDAGVPGGAFARNANFVEVIGGGADIWGTSDAFQFVSSGVSGNFEVIAEVAGLTNTDPWAKAGLMIRQSLAPESRHASVFATPTPTNGVAFQRREFDGSATVHTPGPAVAPSVWLRLVREGDLITAYSRDTDTEPWTLIGAQNLPGLRASVQVGMAVTSHVYGTAATGLFNMFAIAPLSGGLPPGWTTDDVGTVATEGSVLVQDGRWTVQGSGADIWGTHDAFRYVYTPLVGDATITVHVPSLTGSHPWAKAGLMIRESLDPSSPHQFLLASLDNGTAYQRRVDFGGTTTHSSMSVRETPTWFRIQRIGGMVRLFFSQMPGAPPVDSDFILVGEAPFSSAGVLVGVAVTSHADGQLATARVDNISVVPTSAAPPSVTFTAPTEGASIMLGGTLGLSAIARDDHPGVREVVFEAESSGGWTAVATVPNDTGTRVTYVANYTPQAAGPLRLRARAVDHGGFESVSNAVNVLVTDDVNPGWTSLDIGAVTIGGSRAGTPPNVVLMGASGADIWGTADAFRYTYTQLTGNGTIVGRVSALHAPHAWSKAGLMLRQSPTANSPHAFMLVSRDHGLAFQRRTAAGASTVHTSGGSGVAPQWLRLTRTGEVVTASFSSDGVTWTDVGSDILPIGTEPVLVGMALTSHSENEVASAAFENVSVMP